MAHMDGVTILRAIRGVLENGEGSVATILANTYQSGTHEALGFSEDVLAAFCNPRVELSGSTVGRNAASPPRGGNLEYVDIAVEVRLVRSFTVIHSLDPEQRETLRGLAMTDADVVGQALTHPGNLAQDSDSNPTGLVSGCLLSAGSTVGTIEVEDSQSGRLVSTHRFTGIVQTAPATS